MKSSVESMTGYASAEGTTAAGRRFTLSIKAVNHRHLDLAVKVPAGFEALEMTLRRAVRASVARGHVELTLVLERVAAAPVVVVDQAALAAYAEAFQEAAKRLGLCDEAVRLQELFKMPGVVTSSVAALEVGVFDEPVLGALEGVLRSFHAARRAEGEALAAELRAGVARLYGHAEEARVLRAGVAESEYEKLATRLRELLGASDVPRERLLTEAALLAARGDVEEELVRLRAHLDRFGELLDRGGEVGRPLDFLLQELNREANTLLAKTGAHCGAGGLRLTELGLAMKVELERAREQVQNLE